MLPAIFLKRLAHQLQADRQPLGGEPARNGYPGVAGHIAGDRENIGKVHLQGIA